MAFTLNQKVIFASRARNLDLLKERVESGGDINYQDSGYGSALVAAINNQDEEIIQFLLDNGVNVNAENGHGVVPIEVALHHSSDNVVRQLSWAGAKISSRCRPHWKERLKQCLSRY